MMERRCWGVTDIAWDVMTAPPIKPLMSDSDLKRIAVTVDGGIVTLTHTMIGISW